MTASTCDWSLHMIAFTAQIYLLVTGYELFELFSCDTLMSLQVPSGLISCEALDLACNSTALCHVPEWDRAESSFSH